MTEKEPAATAPELSGKLEDIRIRLADILFNLADDFIQRNEDLDLLEETAAEQPSPIDNDEERAADEMESHLLKEVEAVIKQQFESLDESFMYLGILKNMPLPEAMQLFKEKSDRISDISRLSWNRQEYPDHQKLFEMLGEDYQEIKKILHAGDAIDPIYDKLKTVHEYLVKLRDKSMGYEEVKQKILELINTWKAQ
ncbi:MAG: hypothetical protein JXA35_06020 [Deltaproteobacteria bacterium]|nr:hypothetical protein [Deltaproteobacteria bacterium]